VRNLEVEGLQDDSLPLQDLFARIQILGQEDELVNSGGEDFLVLGIDEDGSGTDRLELGDGYNVLCEEAAGEFWATRRGGGGPGTTSRPVSGAFPG